MDPRMIFSAIAKALGQIFDPIFIKVILAGFALAIGLLGAITWALSAVIAMFAPDAIALPFFGAIGGLAALLSWGGFLAMMALSVFLMIPLASAMSALFLDQVAKAVEVKHYPNLAPPRAQTLYEAAIIGINFLGLVIGVNAVALIFYILSGPFAPLLFWTVNGYLLGREYFQLVALRRMELADARALRRKHRGTIWIAGILIAAPLSVPIVNLVITVLGVAIFAHLFHAMHGQSRPIWA
jgi:CysZ protein